MPPKRKKSNEDERERSKGPRIRLSAKHGLPSARSSSQYLKLPHAAQRVFTVVLPFTPFTLRLATVWSYAMAFSRSPALSHFEEIYGASADYDDTIAWSISEADSTMLQSGVLPSALAPGREVDATIDPALLLTQHQDLENSPFDAAHMQPS
ncbi:uncharacterized protein JN550_006063 [Neoarthrinium moseri]|nr:uncharacterized protein JN550_006063 [Neoarthrinium moseri]KAI1869076.1 hypothetical protein JN550_006063 [Neoarthrinium moseri]